MWIRCPLGPFSFITMKQACLVPGGRAGKVPSPAQVDHRRHLEGVGIEGEVKSKVEKAHIVPRNLQRNYLKEVGIAYSNQLET